MYKRASQNLQRAYRVDKPLPTGGYIGSVADQADILPNVGHLGFDECRAEIAQTIREKLRAEADLASAKVRRDKPDVTRIGQQLQVFGSRLSVLRGRERHFLEASRENCLAKAVREILSEDQQVAVFKRAKEIAKDTPMTDPLEAEARRVAGMLTKAQTKRLIGLHTLRVERKSWMSAHGSIYLSCAKASSAQLVDLGLVERKNAYKASTGRWGDLGSGVLTPLGLAVKRVLEERV